MNEQEVRNLMPKQPSEVANEIIESCAKKAKEGHYDMKVRQHGFGEALSLNVFQKKVIRILKEKGFQVEHKMDSKQFADLYLWVSWED